MSEQVVTQAKPIVAKPALNSALQRTAITPVAHGVLQRCSNGVECAECRAKREQQEGTLQRAAVNAVPTPAVPPIVHDVLNSPGQSLDTSARTFMETRFGHDFSGVRVHTDARAAESAWSVNALAYTVGRSVVFGAGQYMPGTMTGKRLLAHELTHVVQQSGQISLMPAMIDRGSADPLEQVANSLAEHVVSDKASSSIQAIAGTGCQTITAALGHSHSVVQRQENMSFAQDTQATPTTNPGRLFHLEQLLEQINIQTKESIGLREKLDALAPASSEERTGLETELDNYRAALIPLLEQRIALLDEEIAALYLAAGPHPVSSAEHPEADRIGYDLLQREAERRQHQNQLRPLLRWQKRRDISEIDGQIAEIDQQLATSSLVSTPETDNLFWQRAELERQKAELAASLTSTATEYKQFDSRWGATRYGQSPNCTNIQAAGCGPTSLAILLNYLYQEDPEGLATSGQMEIVTPQETAPYAATHGRVCNNGTAGDAMVTQVHTNWPGFSGRRISLTYAVGQLRSGNLVIFLCKNCTGKNRSGGDKHYGGHYMVLNGVNNDGTVFNILDPGANEASDIETISQQELQTHTNGFWIVERK